MAKHFKTPKHQTGKTITTKTPYGTTSDMVVTDEEILAKTKVKGGWVLAKDDQGYYITAQGNVDSGLSDPFRYCDTFREKNMSEFNFGVRDE